MSSARRRVLAVVLPLCLSPLLGCAGGGDASASLCDRIETLAKAMTDVRAAEGRTAEAGARFAEAANVVAGSDAPTGLGEQWVDAEEALRYFAGAAADYAAGLGEGATRSEEEIARWASSFSQITSVGIDRCALGWRTAFDDCREGLPPVPLDHARLFFPCRR